MAGDWIKMRSNLHEDPRVIAVAHKLTTEPLHVVGMLFRLWSWADAQSRDGHALSVTTAFLDSLAGVTGFANSLIEIGWLEGTELCFSLPRFEEHNGQTAKARALSRNRKNNQRQRTVPAESRSERDNSVTREEKRREEKIPPVVPPSGGTSEPEGEALPQPPVVVSESMARGWFESMVQAGAPFTPDEFAEAFRLLHSTRDVRTGAWLLGRRGLVSDPRTALEQRLHDTHARRESRAASNQPTGAPSQAQSAFVLRQRIAAMEQNLAAHKGNPQGGYPPAVQEAHHADWRSKNRALTDLRHQLANLNDPTHEPVAA